MAGWDGAGNFSINYIFTQDAANGIKILASKQDTQWATVVAGLMNCQTRDGQNKPSANWDFNGFKIQNLGAPVNPTDAARLQDISVVPAGEWVSQSTPFAFVNGTQFKLTGSDLTARYEIGRRMKITHNAGATTSYYTVTASVFAAGDTTVTVNGPTLVTPLTAVWYAMLDAANLSVPVPSAIGIYGAASTDLTVGANHTLGAAAPFPSTTVTGDIYGEVAAGVFTAKYAGLYLVAAAARVNEGGTTAISQVGALGAFVNGVALRATPFAGFSTFWSLAGNRYSQASLVDIASLSAGNTLAVKLQTAFTWVNTNPQGQGFSVEIVRVR